MLKDKPYSLQEINISDIDFGTRFRKDLGDISALASDISERGVIQPICVLDKARTNGSLDNLADLDSERPFLLLAGERRTRASIKAERETIPALVFERQMNEWEIRVIELHENIMRKEMTPFEKDANIAEIHRTYQEIYGKAD